MQYRTSTVNLGIYLTTTVKMSIDGIGPGLFSNILQKKYVVVLRSQQINHRSSSSSDFKFFQKKKKEFIFENSH